MDNAEPTAEPFKERWGWFITLDAMSNNNFSQWPYLLNLNVHEFLNYVSFMKSKAAYEKRVMGM